jgi:hypothetical protein
MRDKRLCGQREILLKVKLNESYFAQGYVGPVSLALCGNRIDNSEAN